MKKKEKERKNSFIYIRKKKIFQTIINMGSKVSKYC